MKVIWRPLLMVAFVMVMVYFMQQKIEEDKKLEAQQQEIDPNSVIYVEPDDFVDDQESELIEGDEGIATSEEDS